MPRPSGDYWQPNAPPFLYPGIPDREEATFDWVQELDGATNTRVDAHESRLNSLEGITDPLLFTIRAGIADQQDPALQLRIGDQALPMSATVPARQSWTQNSGILRAGFFGVTLRSNGGGYPLIRGGPVPVRTAVGTVTPLEQSQAGDLPAAGDFQLMYVLAGSTTPGSVAAPTLPTITGWTLIQSTGYTNRWSFGAYQRTRGGTPPADVTVTGAGKVSVAVLSFTRVNATTPVDALSSTSGLFANPFQAPAHAATIEANERYVIVGAFDFMTGAGTVSDPAGSQYLPAAGALITVQDESTDLASRNKISFQGAGVTATDDAANQRTIVTIPGAAGGAGTDLDFVVAAVAEGNTATQNVTAIQAALDAASTLTSQGGTAFVPAGNYKVYAGGTINVPSKTTLWMDDRCVLDFSDAPSGGSHTVISVTGTESGYDSPDWQFLTAPALRATKTLAVADSSRYVVGDRLRLASTEIFDPGSRNGWCGEIVKVTGIPDATHVNVATGFADDYTPGTHTTTATVTVGTGGIDAAVTTIPLSDASTLRIPAQYKPGRIRIDTEEISYLWRDDRAVYGCTRGINGTTAASHLQGANVNELPPIAKVSGAHTASITTITLTANSGVNYGVKQFGEGGGSFGGVTNGFVRVQRTGEIIYYRGMSGDSLTSCVRGFKSTAAALVDGDVLEELDGAWVTKMTMKEDVTIRGGTLVGPNLGSSDNCWYVGVIADKAAKFRIKDTKFINVKTMSVALYDTTEFTVDTVHSDYSNRNNYGYGVVLGWCAQDGEIINCNFERSRHGFSAGSSISNSRYSVTGDTRIGAGIPRRVTVAHCHAWGTLNQSYDCHSGCDGIEFVDCWAHDPGGAGFWINAPRVRIQGCHVLDPGTSAIFMVNLTPQPTDWCVFDNEINGGESVVWHIQIQIDGDNARPNAGVYTDQIAIERNRSIDSPRYALSLLGASGTATGTRWTTDGVRFRNVSIRDNKWIRAGWKTPTDAWNLNRLIDPVITGNQFSDCRQNALSISCRGGVVAHNMVNYVLGSSSYTALQSNTCTDTIFEGNVARGYSKGLVLDDASTYCTVGHNNLRNCTTPLTRGAGTGHIIKTTDGATAGDYNRL